ncbi:MAG: hypothetical protein ABIN00_07375 [candidate division WOR-3 bacterium]
MNKLKNYKNWNNKNKIVVVNFLNSIIIKGFSVFLSFLTVPLYLKYFKDKTLIGLWLTLISVTSWIFSFDLGFNHGLKNFLTIAFEKKENDKIKKILSSSYLIISSISFILFLIFISVSYIVKFNDIFNIPSNIVDAYILKKILFILIVGFLINFVLKISDTILFSIQKHFIRNLLNLIASLLLVIFLFLFKPTNTQNSLIIISIVYALSINIPYLITIFVLYITVLKNSLPSFKDFDKNSSIKIFNLGLKFFIIQLIYTILITTNEYLISFFISPEKVFEYQIYYKPFFLVSSIFVLALSPIWSTVTKAQTENDFKWIYNLFKRLKKISFFLLLFYLIMLFFFQFIVNIWLNKNTFKVNYFYSFSMIIFNYIFIFNGILSSIANGLSDLKVQLYSYLFGVVLKFVIIIIFIRIFNSWMTIVWANILGLLIYTIIQPIYFNKKYFSKLGG